GLLFRIIRSCVHEHADASHALALLRARRERPRSRRTAECGQQFPPSDGDCHTPLPCEVRRERYHATPRLGACIGVSVVWGIIPGGGVARSASKGAGEGLPPICPTVPPFSMAARGLPYGHGPPFRPERVSGTSSTLSHGRRYCDRRASADPMDFDGP